MQDAHWFEVKVQNCEVQTRCRAGYVDISPIAISSCLHSSVSVRHLRRRNEVGPHYNPPTSHCWRPQAVVTTTLPVDVTPPRDRGHCFVPSKVHLCRSVTLWASRDHRLTREILRLMIVWSPIVIDVWLPKAFIRISRALLKLWDDRAIETFRSYATWPSPSSSTPPPANSLGSLGWRGCP